MATSYSLMEWHGKWDVVKTEPDSVVKLYLNRVHSTGSGTFGTVWFRDQLYARHYSKKTALRHLRNLRASDPDCDEDY